MNPLARHPRPMTDANGKRIYRAAWRNNGFGRKPTGNTSPAERRRLFERIG